MINALPTALTVRVFTLLVLAFCAVVLALSSQSTAGDLIAAQGMVVLGVNVVVFILTIRPAFLWLHRVTWARLWWFPLLDGTWDVTVWSNWPLVQATLAAARRETPAFDPLTQELASGPPEPIAMTAEIKSSLFGIEMTMEVPGTKRGSRTVFVRPQWCRPGLPTLTYVYEQTDHKPVAVTDVPQHFGAGVLKYHSESDEMRGEYWTQRQGSKGLNTAGTLLMRRAGGKPVPLVQMSATPT